VICTQYLKAMKAAMTKREGVHVRKKNCANTSNLVRRCTLGCYIWTKAGMELFASCVNDMHLVILRPNKKLNVVWVFDKLVTDCKEM
jgi:hypothetical protein